VARNGIVVRWCPPAPAVETFARRLHSDRVSGIHRRRARAIGRTIAVNAHRPIKAIGAGVVAVFLVAGAALGADAILRPPAPPARLVVAADLTNEPAATVEPTETPEATDAPEAIGTPEPADTPEPAETPEPTREPKATHAPKATDDHGGQSGHDDGDADDQSGQDGNDSGGDGQGGGGDNGGGDD
jgi:uncharacterized membrane protein YgcG